MKESIEELSLQELVNKLRSVSWVSGSNDTDEWDDEIFAIKQQILTRFAELEAENKGLEESRQQYIDSVKVVMERLERAKTYTGIEGYPCPLCHYKNGVFIKACSLHQQITELTDDIKTLVESHNLITEERDTKILHLSAQVEQVEKAVQLVEAMNRISDLWLPVDVTEEAYLGEYKTLHAMKAKIEELLRQSGKEDRL